MKKFINFLELVFYLIVIGAIIFIALALFRPIKYESLAPYRFYVVVSDSMSPKIEPMSLVIVDRRKPDVYEVDDIITFKTYVKDADAKSVITHRVAEVIDEKGSISYRTRPEELGKLDRWIIEDDDIVGEVAYILPYMGLFILGIQRVMFPIILISNMIITSLLIQHLLRWRYLA